MGANLGKAQFQKLHDFSGNPNSSQGGESLISVGSYLYGSHPQSGTHGNGTIFKINPDGTGFTSLHDFNALSGSNESHPCGSPISDGVYLYGMTSVGGNFTSINYQFGCGTIYKIKTDGTAYTTLFDFDETSNGANPLGSLYSVGSNLYGMTRGGGLNANGVIFKIKPDGTGYSTLFDFNASSTGSFPFGSLISDGIHLYGMTTSGGSFNLGTVFKIKTDGTGFTVLHNFNGSSDGGTPKGSLYYDGSYLYGMNVLSGAKSSGTLFKIKPDGTSFNVLFDFDSPTTGGSAIGNLISDGIFLYGMTKSGGNNDIGVIFKIKPDGSAFSKLFDFNSSSNGSYPTGSLLMLNNSLYGMTLEGGGSNGGVIFKYDKSPVGITTHDSTKAIRIYPNPATVNFTVQTELEFNNVTIIVYNLLGEIVLKMYQPHFGNGKPIHVSLDNLPTGAYSLQLLEVNQPIINEKLILEN